MALQVLTTDQKEILKASSKFAAMIRSGAYNKANFWINTVDPAVSVPGGNTTASHVKWAKSRAFSTLIFQNPNMPEQDLGFVSLFLANLTVAVWDNVAFPTFDSVAADATIIAMEADAANKIDPAMDGVFDAKIKYSAF